MNNEATLNRNVETAGNGDPALVLRVPTRDDGAAIHALIADCPPLDLNALYAYLLLAEHFAATSVVAQDGAGRLNGYISGYHPPGRPDVLFVWQVAVHERARGQGLGKKMIRHILDRPGLEHVRFIETTVGPSNAASRRMFEGAARALGAPVAESPLFTRAMFGPQGHEDEPLLRIGPFAR